MQTYRLAGLNIANLGTFTNCVEDPFVDVLYGNPAIIPVPDYTTIPQQPYVSNSAPATLASHWSAGATVTPGDTLTMTYAGKELILAFNTGPYQGIGLVTLDGSPYLAVDTYASSVGGTPPGTYGSVLAYPNTLTGFSFLKVTTPNGGQHTVVVTYAGDVNSACNPIGTVTNTVGTSVAGITFISRSFHGATTTTLYTIKALSSTTYSVNGSGTYTVGTAYTTAIAGCALLLNGGTLVTNDTATVQLQGTGLSFASLYVATAAVTSATYTSPIISTTGLAFNNANPTQSMPIVLIPDAPQQLMTMRWLVASWEEDPNNPVTAGFGLTGNSTSPATDANWAIAPALPMTPPNPSNGLPITHDGLGHGFMGLAALPVGGYCQVQLTIPTNGYVRNLRLYAWDNMTDPDRLLFRPGPTNDLYERVVAAMTLPLTILCRDQEREFEQSFSYGTSRYQYLDIHGKEWQLPRPFGMGNIQFAAVLRELSIMSFIGGTVPQLQNLLSTIMGPGGVYHITSLNPSTTAWYLGTPTLGFGTYLGSNTVNLLTVLIQITAWQLTIPPQSVQSILEMCRCVGVNFVYEWI